MKNMKGMVKSWGWMVVCGLGSAASSWAAAPVNVCKDDTNQNCTVGALYQNISIASYSGIQIFYMVCMVMGVAGTIYGLMKLRHHGQDAQGGSGALRQAIYSLIVSSMLICIPTIAWLVMGSAFGKADVPMVPQNTVQNYGKSN